MRTGAAPYDYSNPNDVNNYCADNMGMQCWVSLKNGHFLYPLLCLLMYCVQPFIKTLCKCVYACLCSHHQFVLFVTTFLDGGDDDGCDAHGGDSLWDKTRFDMTCDATMLGVGGMDGELAGDNLLKAPPKVEKVSLWVNGNNVRRKWNPTSIHQ